MSEATVEANAKDYADELARGVTKEFRERHAKNYADELARDVTKTGEFAVKEFRERPTKPMTMFNEIFDIPKPNIVELKSKRDLAAAALKKLEKLIRFLERQDEEEKPE